MRPFFVFSPILFLISLCLLVSTPLHADLYPSSADSHTPYILILFDGPDIDKNPGRIDARYLANLCGHFTARRDVRSLEDYRAGDWRKYDAIFCIVFQRKYRIPDIFLRDIAQDHRPFCWLANQVQQLDRYNLLRNHGIGFIKFSDKIKVTKVFYKDHAIPKGDSETNFLKILDPTLAKPIASALVAPNEHIPYIIQSGTFWVVADSPFSYSGENDRYLVFADVLHDILGIQHAENHSAILRIEDINAFSELHDLQNTLNIIRRHHIPFAFGFVPTYVDPHERIDIRLADKPAIVQMLHTYLHNGGTPVLHGFTHQYRGVTTDDYEFWDDLADRPVRGDSAAFAERRIDSAIKESMSTDLYPVTWETPHYAASSIDYQVFSHHFGTAYERRIGANTLEADECYPYPIIDLYGQLIIPEDLAYVPIEDPQIQPILDAANSASVVRDGYASFFFHPFIDPHLLDQLIFGIQARGYHFIDIKQFPNKVISEGRLITTTSGQYILGGTGRYVVMKRIRPDGRELEPRIAETSPRSPYRMNVVIRPGETFIAMRQDFKPPTAFSRLLQLAKGDFSSLFKRWENVFPAEQTWDVPLKVALLWNDQAKGPEEIDQSSFDSILKAIGYDVEHVDYRRFTTDQLGPFSLLVVPYASARAMPANEVKRILRGLKEGIALVTDGDTPVARGLGIRLESPMVVKDIQDHLYTTQEIHWTDQPQVPWISEPQGDDITVYYSERDQARPLVISGEREEGRYLYFAPLFDPISGDGYARFPDMPNILISELRLQPMLKRRGADVYFDPGYRQSISIEVLAHEWRRRGIRVVHAAAWHFYDKYTYDYARLIRVAHQNGILVYAWFEWPHVSEHFWNQYPEWREKTALLTDAHVDWRYLMNLQNPDSMKAIQKDIRNILKMGSWDGVDVGELTFESLQGPGHPEYFTPMNRDARREFSKLAKFDPIELFHRRSPHYWKEHPADIQAFYLYRQQVNHQLLHTFLSFLQKLNQDQHQNWDIVVTALDTIQHPELADYLGVDMSDTISLVNRYNATLQIEDPASDWSKPPERYTRLGQTYQKLPLKQPFMIDINILPVHPMEQRGFATAQPVGGELIQLWKKASEQVPRVSLYSESTINEQDWDVLPYAMAGNATVTKEGSQWTINAPYTVILELSRGIRKYWLDGRPWNCVEKGDVWIPAGQHTLTFTDARHSWLDTTQLDTRLLSTTGELLGAQPINRGLELEYNSSSRCSLMFNKFVYKTIIDGKTIKLPEIKGDDGFVILAPSGQHRIQAITESPLLYIVEFTSLLSASLIVLFGLASSGLLAFLFLVIIGRRRIRAFHRMWSSRTNTRHRRQKRASI